MVLSSLALEVFAIPLDTIGWIDNSNIIQCEAVELDLKSDLKNDFRVFQLVLTNLTKDSVHLTFKTNQSIPNDISNLLKDGLSFKELMEVATQLALESYKEDVGTGKIAKAHKGFINVASTAGAIAAGVGFLGMYPQQKAEEYFAHRRIKKEFKQISSSLTKEYSLAPLEQKDFLIITPIEMQKPFVDTLIKKEETEISSEFHQL
jgi:hypothetical protein